MVSVAGPARAAGREHCMDTDLLAIAVVLAYGPFAVTIVLYGIGLGLRLAGRSSLLRRLVERTEVPSPVAREESDAHP